MTHRAALPALLGLLAVAPAALGATDRNAPPPPREPQRPAASSTAPASPPPPREHTRPRAQAPGAAAAARPAPPTGPADPPRCAELLALLPVQPGADRPPAVADGPDACRFPRFAVEMSAVIGWEVDEVVLRQLAPPRRPGEAPAAFRAEARGVRFAPPVPGAAFRWIFRQQQEPFDLALEWASPEEGRVELRELSMRGEDLGTASLAAGVEGLGPLRPGEGPDPTRAGLREAELRLHGRRIVTGFLLTPLAERLGDDPEGALREGRATLAGILAGQVARGRLDPASADALNAFARDFPQNREPLRLRVSATGRAVTLEDLSGADTPRGRDLAFDLLRVEARYGDDAAPGQR